MYEDCERSLGFSGNAASDVITAWSRIASSTYEHKSKQAALPVRRASSLSVIPKSVRTPVNLITLERARAQTTVYEQREDEDSVQSSSDESPGAALSMDDLEKSLLQMSIEHSIRLKGKPMQNRVEISGPLHLQEEVVSSYPPTSNSMDREEHKITDKKESLHDSTAGSAFNPNEAIQRYIDKVIY